MQIAPSSGSKTAYVAAGSQRTKICPGFHDLIYSLSPKSEGEVPGNPETSFLRLVQMLDKTDNRPLYCNGRLSI